MINVSGSKKEKTKVVKGMNMTSEEDSMLDEIVEKCPEYNNRSHFLSVQIHQVYEKLREKDGLKKKAEV